MDKIKFVESQLLLKPTFPRFEPGDNVIVNYKIVEGDKTRIQAFKGDILQIAGEGLNKSFTVRKISHGVGVERIFAYSNPNIDSIQIVKKGKVRRARLFYLRGLVGKKARIKERAYSAADYATPQAPAPAYAEVVDQIVDAPVVEQVEQIVEEAAA